MLSLYINTNKMLVQASDIDKQMVYFDFVGFIFFLIVMVLAIPEHPSFSFPKYKTKPRLHLIYGKWLSLKSNDLKAHYAQTIHVSAEGRRLGWG